MKVSKREKDFQNQANKQTETYLFLILIRML